jgi:hypothetical protein
VHSVGHFYYVYYARYEQKKTLKRVIEEKIEEGQKLWEDQEEDVSSYSISLSEGEGTGLKKKH